MFRCIHKNISVSRNEKAFKTTRLEGILSLCVPNTFGRFSIFFHMSNNFCDFLFPLLFLSPFLQRGSTLRGKNLLPRVANSFRLEQTIFQKGTKIISTALTPHERLVIQSVQVAKWLLLLISDY